MFFINFPDFCDLTKSGAHSICKTKNGGWKSPINDPFSKSKSLILMSFCIILIQELEWKGKQVQMILHHSQYINSKIGNISIDKDYRNDLLLKTPSVLILDTHPFHPIHHSSNLCRICDVVWWSTLQHTCSKIARRPPTQTTNCQLQPAINSLCMLHEGVHTVLVNQDYAAVLHLDMAVCNLLWKATWCSFLSWMHSLGGLVDMRLLSCMRMKSV